MLQIPFSAKQLLDGEFTRIDSLLYIPYKIIVYAGCNPKHFKELFGKYSFIYTTYRPLYNWAFGFENAIFLIVTANERGTTVETNTKDANIIERFVDELIEKLKTLNDKLINQSLELSSKLSADFQRFKK